MVLLTGADGVRSTAKGILIRENQVLLNRCRDRYNGEDDYFSLPGGGQEKYEPLEDTLRREMLEETGYRVRNVRFAGLYEEICDDMQYRREYPQYSHKMFYFFLCEPDGDVRVPCSEMDDSQICSEWVPVESLSRLNILPRTLGEHILGMIADKGPFYLGTGRTPAPHG